MTNNQAPMTKQCINSQMTKGDSFGYLEIWSLFGHCDLVLGHSQKKVYT